MKELTAPLASRVNGDVRKINHALPVHPYNAMLRKKSLEILQIPIGNLLRPIRKVHLCIVPLGNALHYTTQATSATKEQFSMADLLKLATNRSFIYITLLCVAFYAAVFPFIQYAPNLLVNKYGFTTTLPDLTNVPLVNRIKAYLQNGSKVTSLIPFGTIIFTPLFGMFIDKKGKAATMMIIGALLLIFSHLSLSVVNNVYIGYTGLLALGIAYSLVPAAMWPSVAHIVAENRLGTAYATMFTVQNYGLALFLWAIGKTDSKQALTGTNKQHTTHGKGFPLAISVKTRLHYNGCTHYVNQKEKSENRIKPC